MRYSSRLMPSRGTHELRKNGRQRTSTGTSVPFYFSWSLSTEEQFYLLWPLAIFFVGGRSLKGLVWLTAGLILAMTYWFRFHFVLFPGLYAVLLMFMHRGHKPWRHAAWALSGVACGLAAYGKRPVFADDSAAVFFFPMIHVRFLEIPPASVAGGDLDLPIPIGVAAQLGDGGANGEPALDEDLEIDEDFLRRVREA